jgi:hypothetical protein
VLALIPSNSAASSSRRAIRSESGTGGRLSVMAAAATQIASPLRLSWGPRQLDDAGVQIDDERLRAGGVPIGVTERRTPRSHGSPLGEPKLDKALEQPIADEIATTTCLNDPGDLAPSR